MERPAIHFEMIDDQMAAIIRGKSGAERLRIASNMFSSARKMLIHHLRAEHPDWQEDQICREAAKRLSHGALIQPLALNSFFTPSNS